MYLLIVCVEMMQIFSLGLKLEKFVHLIVLLFLFLGYYYNFFFFQIEAFEFWYLILLWFFYSWSCLQQFLGFKVTLLSWVFLVQYSALAYWFVLTISHGRFYLTLWDLLDLKVLFLVYEDTLLGAPFFFLANCSCHPWPLHDHQSLFS